MIQSGKGTQSDGEMVNGESANGDQENGGYGNDESGLSSVNGSENSEGVKQCNGRASDLKLHYPYL